MLTPEQKKAKKEYKKNKKIKKWQRRSRFRVLKNLIIYFVGFVSSLAIIAGGVYVGIGVLPISTYVGDDESVLPSEITDLTILNAIQSLGSFNIDDIALSTVMPENDDVIWDILNQAVSTTNEKGITIGDLKNNFDINNVSLETVLPRTQIIDGEEKPANEDIWKTLDEAVTDKPVTIGSLDSFEIGNILLETVLTDDNGEIMNQKLWDILNEAVPETCRDADGKIRIDNLKDFLVDGIHLGTVIDDGQGNEVLTALLNDPDTTLGNIGEKLSGLQLKIVYDIEDFTENPEEAMPSSPKYRKDSIVDGELTHDLFVLDENGTYYISKNSKIWLLLLYSAGEKDANGNALTYTCKDLTLGNINQTISNASNCFMEATIKMLVDSGTLIENTNGQYSKIYNLTVQGVFDNAAV